jgi:hypothetical protein
LDGVKLEFEGRAGGIADKGHRHGDRGARPAQRHGGIMTDVMFNAPSDESIER